MKHPGLVTLILFEWPLHLGSLSSSMVPLVHSLQSSHCMATVEPEDIRMLWCTEGLTLCYDTNNSINK